MKRYVNTLSLLLLVSCGQKLVSDLRSNDSLKSQGLALSQLSAEEVSQLLSDSPVGIIGVCELDEEGSVATVSVLSNLSGPIFAYGTDGSEWELGENGLSSFSFSPYTHTTNSQVSFEIKQDSKSAFVDCPAFTSRENFAFLGNQQICHKENFKNSYYSKHSFWKRKGCNNPEAQVLVCEIPETESRYRFELRSPSGAVVQEGENYSPLIEPPTIGDAGGTYTLELFNDEQATSLIVGNYEVIGCEVANSSSSSISSSSSSSLYSDPYSTVSLTMTGSATSIPASYSIKAVVGGMAPVTRVEFLDGNTIVHTENNAPYCLFGDSTPNGCDLGSLGAGQHTIVAKVYSGSTLVSTSSALTFTEAASPQMPIASISLAPTTISEGQSATLSWSSLSATSCTASGGWSGTQATSGTLVVKPTSTTTYSISCTGAGGSSPISSATLSVLASVPPVSSSSSSSNTSTNCSNCKYVMSGGSGNKSGSDWANAYDGLPSSLIRGTVYYMADGDYPSYIFDDPEIASNSPIQIIKATLENHGTEIGWNSALGDGAANFQGGIKFLSGNWVFDGQRGGGPGSWKNGFGFRINVTQATSGIGIVVGNATNVKLKHFEVTGNGGDGDGNGQENDLLNFGANSKDILVSHAYLHDAGRTLIFNAADNVRYEYIYGGKFESTSGQHAEIASIWKDLSGIIPVRNITFANCIWSHMEGTGGIIMDGDGLEVYGNIFFKPANAPSSFGGGNGAIGTWSNSKLTNSKIYNNTFINLGGIFPLGFLMSQSALQGNVAYNNIFYNSSNVSFQNISTHDYNTFINSPCLWNDRNCNQEPNALVSTTNPFVDISAEDFRLNNPLLAGLKLDAIYAKDLAGTTRALDGTWDRGAYEYAGAGSSSSSSSTSTTTSSSSSSQAASVQVTDASGAIWTMGEYVDATNRKIYRNGVYVNGWGDEIYFNGSDIFVKNSDGTWWKYLGNGWQSASDPKAPATTSSSSSSVSSSSSSSVASTDINYTGPAPAVPKYVSTTLDTSRRIFYIDFSTGSDSNSGTSKSSPWKRHPYMRGFTGSYSHIAGDQFVFRGGVTWTNENFTLNVIAGGASNTLRDYYGIDQSWFVGPQWTRPIFDLQKKPTTGGKSVIYATGASTSNITFEGIEIKDQYIGEGWEWLSCAVTTTYNDNITVRNFHVHDWIMDRAKDENVGGICGWGTGGNTVLEYSDIGPGGPTGIGGSGGFANGGLSSRNIFIVRYNKLHGNPNTILGGGSEVIGNEIYNVTDAFDPDTHENALETFGPTIIRDNIIHDVAVGVTISVGAAFSTDGGDSLIFNNVIYNSGPIPIGADCRQAGKIRTGVRIYNNTLVSGDGDPSDYQGALIRVIGDYCDYLDVRNNFLLTGLSWTSPLSMSGRVAEKTETNNVQIYPADALNMGISKTTHFKITEKALALRDKGTDLSNIFSKDINGIARPRNGAWDVGAYEY